MNTIREQMSTDVCSFRKPVVDLITTRTVAETESGTLFLLNLAAGFTVTLPASATPGTFFDFMVETTLTSGNYIIITAAGTELLVGSIVGCDTDTGNATIAWPALVASSYVKVSTNKTTTGGIKGDSFRFTKINATTWLCNGHVNNNGTVATPFST